MDRLTLDLNGRRAISLGNGALGIFGSVNGLPSFMGDWLIFDRLSQTSHAWRLRGSETLDGGHHEPPHLRMVLLRPRILGARLSAFDGIP